MLSEYLIETILSKKQGLYKKQISASTSLRELIEILDHKCGVRKVQSFLPSLMCSKNAEKEPVYKVCRELDTRYTSVSLFFPGNLSFKIYFTTDSGNSKIHSIEKMQDFEYARSVRVSSCIEEINRLLGLPD